MSDALRKLTPQQRSLLAHWVPDAEVVADHSWGIVDTSVLELDSAHGRLVLKAGGPADGHIERELRAHREWLGPWVATGHAPILVHGDGPAKMLITRYLPGQLVEGTPAQDDPDTYRQAGVLLARFHRQAGAHDAQWLNKLRARVDAHLDRPHRIDRDLEKVVRAEIAAWPSAGSDVVPTHGDWQPRNWLIDDGVVRVIDFGRADLRPPTEDFVRLARQDFTRNPMLEQAFLDGYGHDPREPEQWRRELLREAVGTAVWAHGIGDEKFESFGHQLLRSLYPPAD